MTALEPDYGATIASNLSGPPPVDTTTPPWAQVPASIRDAINAPTAPPVPTPLPTLPAPADTTSIIPNLPNARQQLISKYARYGPHLQSLPPALRSSLIQFDIARVNKGQSPLNDAETVAALTSALTHRAATPASHDTSILHQLTSLPSHAVSDIAAVTKGIGQLLQPNRGNPIFQELFHNIPKWGSAYQKNLAAGMNPAQAFLQSPGIRFIPGSFIASNIASGTHGLGNLLEHPVFTVLDALPYASRAAASTAVGEAALESGTKPIRAVLTKSLDDAGELVPGKLGKITTPLTEQTRVGQILSQTFGHASRDLARTTGSYDQLFAETLLGNTPVTGISQTARDAYALTMKRARGELGIPDTRLIELTDLAQDSRAGRGWINDLPEHEQVFMRQALDLTQQFQDHLVAEGELVKMNGQLYDPKTVRPHLRASASIAKQTAKLSSEVLPRVEQLVTDIENSAPDPSSPASIIGPDKIAWYRTVNLRDQLTAALDPSSPINFRDVVQTISNLKKSRTALGSSVTGELPGPASNIRLDTITSLEREVRKAALLERTLSRPPVPPSFIPLIQKLAGEKNVQLLVDHGVDKSLATEIVSKRNFAAYPDLFDSRIYRKTVSDIAKTWQELSDNGADPIFIHHVSPTREAIIRNPRVSDFNTDLTQTRARSLLSHEPYNRDWTVALGHQGAEIIRRNLTQLYVDQILETHGVDQASLVAKFLPQAERDAARDPFHFPDPERHALNLALETANPYDPQLFKSFPRPNLANAEQVWLPKAIYENLRRLHEPGPNALASILGTPTNIFRTSVLSLSPRWLFNNVFGNSVITLMENPGALTKYAEARRLIGEAARGSDELPIEIRANLNIARHERLDNPLHASQWARGEKTAAILQRIQSSIPARALKAWTDKAYDINAWFDDMNRVANWDYTRSRALSSGAAESVANNAGLEAAYRTSMFWTELTPIERNMIRQVFPFYAWTSKMIRNILRYPTDHPAVTAILSNITDAELHDHKDGLGIGWLDSIGLGPVGADGMQKQLYLKGINPFSDVADTFTIAGFLSGLNPVIKSVTDAAGMSTESQFANQTIDPTTGRAIPSTSGFLTGLANNLIPQIQGVERLLNLDPDFRRTMRDNPDSANRMLAGALGLPTPLRDVNVPQQYFTQELARQTVRKQDISDALKSGELDALVAKYPDLAPIVTAIKAARDKGLLTAYNPQGTQAGAGGKLAGLVKVLGG